MSEFNAALGLLQLQHVGRAIERRGQIAARYRELLTGLPGVRLMDPPADASANHSYFPVLVGGGFPISRDELYQKLKDEGVHVRRYFYPLISDFPMYRGLPSADPAKLPVARAAASQVLCLPIYPALADADVERVADVVRHAALSPSSAPATADLPDLALAA
jgi:dTDP-4-amino-4,6-dideoxygalactose transaminase